MAPSEVNSTMTDSPGYAWLRWVAAVMPGYTTEAIAQWRVTTFGTGWAPVLDLSEPPALNYHSYYKHAIIETDDDDWLIVPLVPL